VKAIADGIEAGRQKVSAVELRAPRNGGAQVEETAAAEEPVQAEEIAEDAPGEGADA